MGIHKRQNLTLISFTRGKFHSGYISFLDFLPFKLMTKALVDFLGFVFEFKG